jgi:hypothetical protein
LADSGKVLNRKFPGRLHGLATTGGEEHPVEVSWSKLGESTRKTCRRLSGVTPKREVGKFFGLSAGGFSELGAAMPNVYGEQAAEAIEELASGGVVYICALATFNDGQSIALGSSKSGEVAPNMSS